MILYATPRFILIYCLVVSDFVHSIFNMSLCLLSKHPSYLCNDLRCGKSVLSFTKVKSCFSLLIDSLFPISSNMLSSTIWCCMSMIMSALTIIFCIIITLIVRGRINVHTTTICSNTSHIQSHPKIKDECQYHTTICSNTKHIH